MIIQFLQKVNESGNWLLELKLWELLGSAVTDNEPLKLDQKSLQIFEYFLKKWSIHIIQHLFRKRFINYIFTGGQDCIGREDIYVLHKKGKDLQIQE